MTRYFSSGLMVLVAGLLIMTSQQSLAQDKSATRTVKVKLNYTGSGTVDEKHKIAVALWDSPDFVTGGGAMPIAVEMGTSKDGTVLIIATTSPVYASAAYDPTGNWDIQSGPPPSGTSLGVYSKTPGKPEPIHVESGKTAEVELPFDDSIKVP